MNLTKEQIQKIDKKLEKGGFTYWDIRLEMLDHIVSDIENQVKSQIDFKTAKASALEKFYINNNFSSLNQTKLLTINKIVRTKYFKGVIDVFKSLKSILILSLFIISYFLVFKYSSQQAFKITTLLLFILPATYGIVLHFLEFTKKQKSAYIIYGSFYIFFSLLMLNGIIQFCKPDGIIPVSKEIQKIIWFLVTVVNSIFSVAGIHLFLKIKKQITSFKTV